MVRVCIFAVAAISSTAGAAAAAVAFPLDRSAYVVGERVPIALPGATGRVELTATGPGGAVVPLYTGPAGPLVLDSAGLAPGDYRLAVNGRDAGVSLVLVSGVRRSAAALTDECLPDRPRPTGKERGDPAAYRARLAAWQGRLRRTLGETGVNVCFAMGAADMGRRRVLGDLGASGAVAFANPDTRPISFFPPRIWQAELDAYRQKLALTAQLNARYPSFAGFCFSWDPTGFLSRKGLMVYWTWGDKEQALRRYIARSDEALYAEFRRRTHMEPPSESEYITYLLSIGRPEFAPAIDLPTSRWLSEIADKLDPLPEADRVALERRIDAWSRYLMGIYEETYAGNLAALRAIAPSMRHTTTVQIDHCATKDGQYHPSAYRPLDVRYMSMWNDQIGGPDFAYQWVFSAAMMDADNPRARPIWAGHALGEVHGRCAYPGKFVRAIAHNLAYGGSGAGFALEGFSNVLGGMNRQTRWEQMRRTPRAEGLLAGREFLDRFASLATAGRGRHGVGILYSRSQRGREYGAQKLGTTAYKAFVSLLRLGYTPRFVTEEEIIARGTVPGVRALVVFFQTVPLPWRVLAGIDRFARAGGKVLADRNTLVELPAMQRLPFAVDYYRGGKPHNLGAPNLPKGMDHSELVEQWHARLGPPLREALGPAGLAALAPKKAAATDTTVLEIDGGPDATYVVAVNDSRVRTHADWYEVTEELAATRPLPATAGLYDLNEEKPLPAGGPVACDLSRTTARVFAILPRAVGKIDLSATQEVPAGGRVTVGVGFRDAAGKALAAALPFHLSLAPPDGSELYGLYRATDRKGRFAVSLDIPVNAPAGEWTLAVRSQLTGRSAALPVRVAAGKPRPMAAPLKETVVVRDRAGIERILADRAGGLVVCVFDGPAFEDRLALARRLQETLKRRGVGVEVLAKPARTTCWLAYDPTGEQLAENARAEAGRAFGKIRRTTVNRNDYFGAQGGYAFGRNVILLDLVGEKDNEPAEHLAAAGALWPEASRAWPGAGRAVVQTVHKAFSPRASAIVVQAADAEGLSAGVDALGRLPADWISGSVAAARSALLAGLHVGDEPQAPTDAPRTARGLTVRAAPRPFRMKFLGAKPIAKDRIPPREPVRRSALALPNVFEPRHVVPQLARGEAFVEAMNPGGGYLADMRFYDAVLLHVDVRKPGRTEIAVEGLFRYSDRRPRSQASWEDILALRDRLIKPQRRAMCFEARLDGKPAGKLDRLTTATQDVPVKTLPSYVKAKANSITEEVVVRVAGELDLPAGEHKLLLILRNIVDGRLDRIRLGLSPEAADDLQKKRKAAEAAAKKRNAGR